MITLQPSRMTKKAPQLALRLDTLPVAPANWHDGRRITFLGRELIVRLGTHRGIAEIDGTELHLPLPPEASPRQIQDSAEAWLRQQCLAHVEALFVQLQNRQLVLMKQEQRQATTSDKTVAQKTRSASSRVATRRPIHVHLSFASRSPWITVENAETLRCNWHLIELPPAVITQHAEKALGQLAVLDSASSTTDMFSALST